MNSSPLVSVVVPVYKVEQYLHKCVESILRQTYRNLEIILIDDGSPDSCPDICDNYADKDSRVRVIHKENGGLSDARNAGLKIATGEWVSFVDSDDWVEPDFIATLLEVAQKNSADISVCAYTKVYDDKPGQKMAIGEQQKVMTSIEAMRDLLTYKKYGGVMTWNKLYKLSIFRDHNIEFPKGKIHEDNFTTYKTYYYANRIAYTDKPLLYYLQRSDSIMNRDFDDRRTYMIEAAEEVNEFVAEHNLPLIDEATFMLMSSIMQCLQALHTSGDRREYGNIETKLFDELISLGKKAKNNPYLRLKDKARLRLAKVPRAYRTLSLAFEEFHKIYIRSS